MRHVRFVTGGLDAGHDVVRVLLHVVVHRGVEVGLRAVVVDREAAADVEVAHPAAHLAQLHVELTGLAHRVLDGDDARDLAAEVKVQELQAVEHVALLELVDDVHDLRGRQAELGAIAGRGGPPAHALAAQLRAHAEARTDVELLGRDEGVIELFDALEDDQHLVVEALRDERRLDVRQVLVTVAEDEAVFVFHRGERDQQLGLRPGLEAKSVRPAGVDDLLHHVALLVHLDGEHAAVGALVAVLLDGALEAAREQPDAIVQDVWEADQQRQVEPARDELLRELVQVDGAVLRRVRPDLDVPGVVDGEVRRAPAFDLVAARAVADRPTVRLRHHSPGYSFAREPGAPGWVTCAARRRWGAVLAARLRRAKMPRAPATRLSRGGGRW